MMYYLSLDELNLLSKNAIWTAKEITQQPDAWRKVGKIVKDARQDLDAWLSPLLKNNGLRIILTGAGTSSYIGNSLSAYLTKINNRYVESISTTDIVSCPNLHLYKDVPTLLVSYSRSGSSPESIAAIELADDIIDECYHLIITCNPVGELSLRFRTRHNTFILLMPEETHDKSFAMTSSFTSMYVASLCIFSPVADQLDVAAQWAESIIKNCAEDIKKDFSNDCNRVVFLGSGPLLGIAQEAALKCLELTAGKTLSYHESPLGFRHGPKTLVDNNTEIIILSSQDRHTAQYDNDLYAELVRNNRASSIRKLTSESFLKEAHASLDDAWLGLPYIVYCQILAFFKSLHGNTSPDNPSPNGEVNRVVQGVKIYSYHDE